MRTWCLFLMAACTQQRAEPATNMTSQMPNYQLSCAAAETANSAIMQCVRTDTRTGDVQLVDYMRLPVSKGSTAVGAATPGRFTTACEAPGSNSRADFLCVRMNTETGELLLVNLTEIGVLPPRGQ